MFLFILINSSIPFNCFRIRGSFEINGNIGQESVKLTKTMAPVDNKELAFYVPQLRHYRDSTDVVNAGLNLAFLLYQFLLTQITTCSIIPFDTKSN